MTEQLFRWTGRKIAVTGARGGLGSALVSKLKALGCIVTPVSRGTDWDPSDHDILFLNAGFGLVQSSADPVLESAIEMFRVNVLDTVNQAQKALAHRALHVHVVGSVQAIVSSPHLALYSASKYALRGWAYGSARELPGRVSISYPNGIRTNFFTSLQGDPKLLSMYAQQVEATQSMYDDPGAVATGILEGISWGAREIIPTQFALEWFTRNGEDIRRMWHPGLQQPSVERWDWWDQIQAYYRSIS